MNKKGNEMQEEKELRELLKDILSKEELDKYIKLSISVGMIQNFLQILEEQGVLSSLSPEEKKQLKSSFDLVLNYSKIGLSEDIGKEKAKKIIKVLEEKLPNISQK